MIESIVISDFKKITFRLKTDEDGYPPVSFESLWGISQGENSALIDNLPYYIYGVSKGDIVAFEIIEGECFASAVTARGGHSTLRVFSEVFEQSEEITQALREFGAACSKTKGLSLFVVDIPPEVNFQKIDSYLAAMADGERVAYEDACLQHEGIDLERMQACLSLASIPLRLH